MQRRRLLSIVAASAVLGVAPEATPASPVHRWRGAALGAQTHIDLYGEDPARAALLIQACLAEIDRLENIFSLQRAGSAICRLNETGCLERPPLELVEVAGLAQRVAAWSDGAFDPTVQPLWRLWAEHFGRPGARASGPRERSIEAVRHLIDYRRLEVAATRIRFGVPGMGLTLNGIAQGFIADRLADLLQAEGCSEVMLDVGEIRTIGAGPNGLGWPFLTIDRRGGCLRPGGAVATSAPAGGWFHPARGLHHLLDPATGRPAVQARAVSVIARSATLADALSTAIAIGSSALLEGLAAWPGIEDVHMEKLRPRMSDC